MSKNVIWVGPADGGNDKPLLIEGQALEDIQPGYLVEETATGIQVNTADATDFGGELLVANKNSLQSRDILEAWASGENVTVVKPRSGEFLNVYVAAPNNITTRGTALTRVGGLLRPALTDGTEKILCYADEIINVTPGQTLVRVRIV